VNTLYIGIKEIVVDASEIMKGENPPTTGAALKTLIIKKVPKKGDKRFDDNHIQNIIDAMIKHSKKNGKGSWKYYKTEIKKL
jgi:hypothetical protein